MRLIPLALSALVAATPAVAQEAIVGQWQCEQSSQSKFNRNVDTWSYKFLLQVSPDGTFQALGSYVGLWQGYDVPFVGQGRWSRDAGGFSLNGQAQHKGEQMARPFYMALTTVLPQSMTSSFDTGTASMASGCQR